MHVFGSEENFKYFIALVLKLLMKNISNLFVRLFVISLLTFRYFSVIVSIFGAGAESRKPEPEFFTAPAPAPTKMCRLRRLQLRLRLRIPAFNMSLTSHRPLLIERRRRYRRVHFSFIDSY